MQKSKQLKLKSWILASRPKTLPAAIIPVIVGSSVAYHFDSFELFPASIALACSLLIQVATNFVNDLYDYLKGTDDKDERLGPERALASGLLSVKEMKTGIYTSFGLAFILGLLLVYHAGWIILLIGILSLISGYAYTAGPFPLAYNGLGDLFVFIFFGLVATMGTYYVQTLELNSIIFYSSIPVGLLITNILVVNNYRDREGDRQSNKKTLAVLFGGSFAQFQYIISFLISFAIPTYFYFSFDLGITALLPLLTIPLALLLIKMIFTLEGKALNKTLELTAKFGLLFSILFSLSFIL